MSRLASRGLALDARVLAEPLGGLRRYGDQVLPRLAASAQRAGCEVQVFSGASLTPAPWPTGTRHLRLAGLHRSGLRWIWERLWLPRALRRSGATTWFSPLGTTVPTRTDLRQVVMVHDLAFLDPTIDLPPRHRRYWRGMLRRAHHADVVVTPSQTTADRLHERCPAVGEAVAVTHGIDHSPAPFPPRSRQIAMRSDRIEILWVGTLDRRKNVPFLVDVCRRLRDRGVDLKLVIVGRDGNDLSLAQRLRSEPGWIERAGEMADEDLAQLVSRATLLACPSVDEGFGLPVAEAMASGLPVVVSDRGALPEVVGDAGVVLPLEENLWIEELSRLVCDRERLDELAAKGRSRSSIWTWQRHVAELAELLGLGLT